MLTFTLSIDYSYAKKPGKWKPGIENDRPFPIDRTLQIDKRNPNNRTLQNDGRVPIGRTLQDERIPNDNTLQNDKRNLIDRSLQNYRRISVDRTLQNDRRIPIDKTLQNDKRIPIDTTWQNYRKVHRDRALQNLKKNLIDRTVQNDRRIPNYKTNQPDGDGLMQKVKRIKINKILEQDHNGFEKKIDRLLQNGNLQANKRVRGVGRMLTNRRMQNYENIQNNLKAQNGSDEFQKMINARRIGYDKRMRAANLHPILRQRYTPEGKNFTGSQEDEPTEQDDEEKSRWQSFIGAVKRMMENLDGWQPAEQTQLNIRACYCIATTYISALHDFRRYNEKRYMYENNAEFEIGYLVSEILSKYQRMLELYNLSISYYFKKISKNYMPVIYMLYMYTNVLEMGTVITHLCNMLAEIEDKVEHVPIPLSGFTDYHHVIMAISDANKNRDDSSKAKELNADAEFQKILNRIQQSKTKKRAKKKKIKAADIPLDTKPTTPARRPKRYWRDRIYGWSIESW